MAKARAPRAGPKVYAKQLVIEVPKAMLRQGTDEMRGIPVLLFQNW